ncbi:PilN domain-containing protein [Pseudomonas sp. CAU 1711]|uniref:PilN domain-containing protein n=1 Tax=Pseudomonas sp. CAU 1711 TaxID=3140356 RepID=UPI0032612604
MQNINLYQVRRARRAGPRPAQMLLGLGLLLALCLLHGAWLGWQLHRGAQDLARAEAQAQARETHLAAAQAGFVEPQLDARLPAELAEREAANRQLQRLIDYLDALAGQQRGGFVAPLSALAEHHPQGRLWLTAIHLSEGGSQLRLQGRSQSRELLPQYLEALGRSPQFKGRQFARLDVERGEDRLLAFDLSSRPAEQEKADE